MAGLNQNGKDRKGEDVEMQAAPLVSSGLTQQDGAPKSSTSKKACCEVSKELTEEDTSKMDMATTCSLSVSYTGMGMSVMMTPGDMPEEENKMPASSIIGVIMAILTFLIFVIAITRLCLPSRVRERIAKRKNLSRVMLILSVINFIVLIAYIITKAMHMKPGQSQTTPTPGNYSLSGAYSP